ncbi:HDIG domain-containing protein, partial [Candidatus Parcubacteria bacterium]|nr:HDIG domain-containing protein [Candidatus Parcubacteria bacterium]
MERKELLNLLEKHIKSANLIKHSLAVEAGMRALADYFGEDKEKWGICGLLHDIDYEKTKNSPELHSKMGSEMLKNLGFDREICEAV